MGGIEWQDETYGVAKAAKWRASGPLRALMREYRGRKVSQFTNNNSQRKLDGSKAPEVALDRNAHRHPLAMGSIMSL